MVKRRQIQWLGKGTVPKLIHSFSVAFITVAENVAGSKIAEKLSVSRTKANAIIENVIGKTAIFFPIIDESTDK